MSTQKKMLSDLQENSQSKIESIKSSTRFAQNEASKVAYEKDTTLMYKDIKESFSNLMRTIENTVYTKKIAAALDTNICDDLYDAPLMYQEINGNISVTATNGSINGVAILSNSNTYSSWYRKQLGVEIQVTICQEDKTNYNYNQQYTQTCLSQEREVTIEIPFSININDVVSDVENTRDANRIYSSPLINAAKYTANIRIIPFIIINEQLLYYYDETVLASYNYENGVYSDCTIQNAND